MVRNNDSGGDQNYSAEDVRTHACKILANLAAIDEHNAVRVVQEGGLRAILSVFGGFNSLSNSEAVSLFILYFRTSEGDWNDVLLFNRLAASRLALWPTWRWRRRTRRVYFNFGIYGRLD